MLPTTTSSKNAVATWRRGISSSSDNEDNVAARISNSAGSAVRSAFLTGSSGAHEHLAIDTADDNINIDDDDDSNEGGDDPASRVYRPLLFQSSGYASSALFRDTYEMRTRMQERQSAAAQSPTSALLPGAASKRANSSSRHAAEPRIRLETLSSRAATTVLWITYVSFALALATPYLQSQGFLGSVVTLSGNLCAHRIAPHEPCIYVDKRRGIARWSGFVPNVSRIAGAIELSLAIHDVRSATATDATVAHLVDASALQQMNALWTQRHPLGSTASRTDSGSSSALALDVVDQSFVLAFDAFLYGVDVDTVPYTKHALAVEMNQSVWVECTSTTCARVPLLDVSQDVVTQDGTGFDAYLAVVLFHGAYPNVYGKAVTYDFAYTKPIVHASELVVRGLFLLTTVLALPCWLVTVLTAHDNTWSQVLAVQKWVFALGAVLLLWQNPVDAVTAFVATPSLRVKFVAAMCEASAESFFYVFWLHLLDRALQGRLAPKLAFGCVLLALDTAMTVVRMPALFSTESTPRDDEVVALLGVARIAALLIWVAWIVRISYTTGAHLRRLPYMSTRFEQLSFRFLWLETLLIVVYVLVLSGRQVVDLVHTWSQLGYQPFIQRAVHVFATTQVVGRPALGQLVFLSVYVYLVLFVHLPPAVGDHSGLLATTAFHVREAPRVDRDGFLLADSALFCVETAAWLLEMAYHAYFDMPGRPTPSGYGDLDLSSTGFELVAHLRGRATDTHVLVALDAQHKRLVVAFRGTTSRANWKSNLRFNQKVLWVQTRSRSGSSHWRRRSCWEATRDAMSKIPLLNMALPRVHSGFWKAYASVRDELQEVTRLIVDEHPGVSVFVTGHSMGGALAALAAYDLAVNLSMHVTMYNFGGPRVGNPSFARHYDTCVPASYRVVMDGDIVPGVPRFWGLYQHVGTEVAIDVEGNLIVDPSFIERHLHVSSKTRTATHATSVYRHSVAKCLETLSTRS